jgi:hypothetical protein
MRSDDDIKHGRVTLHEEVLKELFSEIRTVEVASI